LINFQGTLTRSDGRHLDGSYSINFLIYDVETDGDHIWKETRDVFVSNGTTGWLGGLSYGVYGAITQLLQALPPGYSC
jgi:hypothetical protein